ncbi:complex I subunit 4 family protein [Cerasicoccus arenae]|uniref:NADH dehydrogenase subunit M n=1 Tax=Cerasicoccus arenae TaxID=424488 RepID=A0A8J3DF31_9BACT|nr:NADH-quinone oxidoreductase subunit M [Cerasicoccus arenae]MBK1856634.1 NADH-quinone oxidoreductase subunit M [Cerasicoccus arenae]GHC12325.1 NADH dehydrogenase subunit M [Cerasicoccus arenae]
MFSDFTLLLLSIFIPLSAAVVLFFGKSLGNSGVRLISAIGFMLPAGIAVYLWMKFNAQENLIDGFAYVGGCDLGLRESVGITLLLGLNGISMPLFLLAGIVGLAAGIHAMYSQAERLHLYMGLLLVMQAGLMGVFCSIDIFFFYFFHELALIPTFIMIGLWGGEGRRAAAMEMTVYLTLGAMLSLLGLIALYGQTGWDTATGFSLIGLRDYFAHHTISEAVESNIFALLLFGFGILVSLFPFHSWAPRGYANAPTANAMLHAGVLKKFGLYGLVQIAAPLIPHGALAWNDWIVWLALGNILIIGFVTIAQSDLKLMIGYSSVMHMGYIFLGIATMSVVGIGGAVMLMFAHGISVALMFVLATAVFNRTGTYDMKAIGGLGPKAPVLAGFFVAASMASIGLPGFANFWGEFTIFIALWENHPWAVAPAVFGVVISAIYGLRAASNIFFGSQTKAFTDSLGHREIGDITLAERAPATILLVTLAFIGLWPMGISQSIQKAVEADPVYTHAPAKLAERDNAPAINIADTEASLPGGQSL